MKRWPTPMPDMCRAMALGRDYHKLLRNSLQAWRTKLSNASVQPATAFVDSGPVLEKALARNAGLG